MSRRSWMAVAILALLAGAVAVLVLADGREKPSASIPAEPAETAIPTKSELQTPFASTEPMLKTESALDPGILEGPLDTVRPLRNPDEVVQSDPEAVQFLTAMKEHWGWNKIKTLKCTVTMTNSDFELSGNPRTTTVKSEMSAEFPGKVLWLSKAELPGETLGFFDVTDGRFFQAGSVSSDGTRTPSDASDVDPRDRYFTFFNGDIYNPELFYYEKPHKVTVEPGDAAFQGVSLPENNEFIVLTFHRSSSKNELHLDPATMEIRVIKTYSDGEADGCASLVFGEIEPGIMYPTNIDMVSMKASIAGEGLHEVHTEVEVSGFEVNAPIDPATFSFAPGKKRKP